MSKYRKLTSQFFICVFAVSFFLALPAAPAFGLAGAFEQKPTVTPKSLAGKGLQTPFFLDDLRQEATNLLFLWLSEKSFNTKSGVSGFYQ